MTVAAAILAGVDSRNSTARRLASVSGHVRPQSASADSALPREMLHYCDAPWRAIAPTSQCSCCPGGRLVSVAEIAGIRNFQCLGLRRPNEAEGVAADLHVSDGLGDLRHMAGDARAARAAGCVVRVLLDAGGMRPVLGIGAVASQAKRVAGLAHHRLVVGAVRVVATEAGDAARIHQALDEIIALHAVFVRGAVGKMREAGFAELVLLELPKIREIQADVKAHRPVVILSLDRIGQRTPLGMTLDARVIGMDIVEAARIEDIVARRAGDVCAAGSVALFAADIPFADGFGRDVVVHRMAAVAERSRSAA